MKKSIVYCVIFTLLLVFAPADAGQNVVSLALSQEKDGTKYDISLTINSKAEMLCATAYHNDKTDEIYRVLILDDKDFPNDPPIFLQTRESNLFACWKLSNVPEKFSLLLIKMKSSESSHQHYDMHNQHHGGETPDQEEGRGHERKHHDGHNHDSGPDLDLVDFIEFPDTSRSDIPAE